MSRDIDKVRQYIADKHNGLRQFGDDDDIIENRLIDSLQFVEFVLYLEELTGTAINMETINIEDFRTISKIESAFFA